MSGPTTLDLSVVVPALNEGEYLRRTVEQLRQSVPPRSEIIVVDDGSADGCCDFLRAQPDGVRLLEPSPMRLGVSGARNRGAAAGRGEIVVFLDGHVDMRAGWLQALCDAALDPAVGAVGPGIAVMGRPECCGWGMRYHDAALGIEWLPAPGNKPPEVPMLAGACIAMRRELFERIGGFDEGLIRWGSEDAELSLRLWMEGYEQRVVPDVTIDHLFRDKHPYAVDWAGILYNQLRVAFVHFTQDRVRRVIERMKPFGDFAAACALLADSDTSLRRDEVHARRSRDDDAYFARFGDIH
ncbi:MAG: glycosyltransferase [Proteobacteria bacterium]|nr:glycosyltransferase [Pseudomonadota bacterium]